MVFLPISTTEADITKLICNTQGLIHVVRPDLFIIKTNLDITELKQGYMKYGPTLLNEISLFCLWLPQTTIIGYVLLSTF